MTPAATRWVCPKASTIHASVAALGIAAHEAGHAMQKKEGNSLLALRGFLVPVVNIGSNLSIPIVIAGLALSIGPLVTVGIALFALAVVFALITLPVEFNASARAIRMLTAGGYITGGEEAGVRKVLNAAAMTYVASAIGTVVQLMRLLALSRSRATEFSHTGLWGCGCHASPL